jgi:hypothetical protein
MDVSLPSNPTSCTRLGEAFADLIAVSGLFAQLVFSVRAIVIQSGTVARKMALG